MVGTGAKAFLAAERRLAVIQQRSEELPAGGSLPGGNAQLGRHPVGRRTSGHGPRDALQPLGIAGAESGIGRQHRQGIRWRYIEVAAQDHIAVAIAIGGGAEIGRALAGQGLHQIMGMDQIGIGMAAAEILQRDAVHHRALGGAQAMLQDLHRIGAGDRVHGVEFHAEPRLEGGPDGLEVEQAFHQLGIVGDRVEDLHHHLAQLGLADLVQIQIGGLQDAVLVDHLGPGIDGLGDGLRRGAARRNIVLDAEILGGAAGIVAGRQDDAAEGLVFADDAGGRRGGKDAALAHHDSGKAVGGGHLQDDLDGGAVVIAAITAHHQGLARHFADAVEHRLDEVFQIVGLNEDRNLFAQAGCAGLLPSKGSGGDDLHGSHDGVLPTCDLRFVVDGRS